MSYSDGGKTNTKPDTHNSIDTANSIVSSIDNTRNSIDSIRVYSIGSIDRIHIPSYPKNTLNKK